MQRGRSARRRRAAPLCLRRPQHNINRENKSRRSARYYRVKVNFITIDERTAAEKRTASYIIVEAIDFPNAIENFNDGMRGTLADFEIESIAETKYIDVYPYAPGNN